MKFLYSSFALWSIFATLPEVPRLEPTIWRSLKAAGIAKLLSSRRGCRGGRNKQRPITSVLGYGRYQPSYLRCSTNLNSNIIYSKSNNGFLLPYMQILPEPVDHSRDNNTSSTPSQPRVIVLHQPKKKHQHSSTWSVNLDHNKLSTRKLINVNTPKTIPTSYSPKVRFALWNARSIKNKTTSLCDFIISRQIDIMVITETWLNGDGRDDRTIADISNTLPTHNITHLPRLNRNGGGIATIIRKGLAVTENKPTHNYAAMECLDINLNAGNKSLQLISIYRPPPSNKNGLTPAMFFDDFSNLLENLSTSQCNCLISGDFNFHMDVDNPDAKHFKDLIDSAAMVQHVDSVTHNKGHILDLIITQSDSDLISNLRTCMELPSDHATLTCTLDFPRPGSFNVRSAHRKIRQIDRDCFDEDMSALPLFHISPPDLTSFVTEYNTNLSNLLDKHAPICERSVMVRPHSPWFSDELRKLKVDKRRWERKWRNSGLEIHKQIYREIAGQYYSAIEQSKKIYYQDKVSGLDQKQLFKFIDGLFRVKLSSPLPTHVSSLELAQRFSEYFSGKVVGFHSDIDNIPSQPLRYVITEEPSLCNLTEFAPVLPDTVTKIIMKSPSKSCSLDPLPSTLLKRSITKLSSPIARIVNMSLHQGEFPSNLKHGLVIPLLKKASLDPEELKNYRPVSNLSFLSKTLERVVSTQLNEYLLANNLHAKMQSAYRPHHSTETALLRVYNDINLALDQHSEVILVLLDLSSAFDTLDHTILTNRLETRFGLKGTVLKWYNSYLSNRTQSTVVDHTVSSSSNLMYGVPQGSVLGPLLFSLYVSPLEDIVNAHNLQTMMYADDTQLYLITQNSGRSTGLENAGTLC